MAKFNSSAETSVKTLPVYGGVCCLKAGDVYNAAFSTNSDPTIRNLQKPHTHKRLIISPSGRKDYGGY